MPLAALALSLPSVATAQSTSVVLSEGVAAYRDLDFAAAVELLQRALSPNADQRLEGEERTRAMMYLGAAQLFADRQDQATATFRALVVQDPAFRPDTVVFPPRATSAFYEILATTKAVTLDVPAQHILAVDSALPIGIHVTSPHLVTVLLEDREGRSLATIFNGEMNDRQDVSWDGRDANGAIVADGRYYLRALSAAAPGTALRSVAVPLTIRRQQLGQLPEPTFPSDQLLPEHRNGASMPLVLSAFAFAIAVAGPALIGNTDHDTPRLAIGGALTIGGVVELIRGGSGGPIPENLAHNERLREEHRLEMARVRDLNRRREQAVRLEVRAGALEHREGR